jgi:hypothetical protein
MIGKVHGNIPTPLADALVAEYNKSGSALRTKNVEIILTDWLDRLRRAPARPKADAPTGDEEES